MSSSRTSELPPIPERSAPTPGQFACFTFVSPDGERDLYIDPAQPTPAEMPVSMAHVTAGELERLPLREASTSAPQAVLSPGGSIFIPKNSFHHVQALERFNMLVNCWWDATSGRGVFHG